MSNTSVEILSQRRIPNRGGGVLKWRWTMQLSPKLTCELFARLTGMSI